jgi:hypothetical protein
VREPTTESYCSNAQRFEATFAEESSAISTDEGRRDRPSGPRSDDPLAEVSSLPYIQPLGSPGSRS